MKAVITKLLGTEFLQKLMNVLYSCYCRPYLQNCVRSQNVQKIDAYNRPRDRFYWSPFP